MENNSNVCVSVCLFVCLFFCLLFNSVVQALFSLPSFRDQIKHFTTDWPSDADAASNVKTLFRDIEQSRQQLRSPIRTHESVQFLGMTGYVKK